MGLFSMDDLDMGTPPEPRCFVCGRKGTKNRPLKRIEDTDSHEACQEAAERIWRRAFNKGKLHANIENARKSRLGFADTLRQECSPQSQFQVGHQVHLIIGDASETFQVKSIDHESGEIELEPFRAHIVDMIGHEVDQAAWDAKMRELTGE